MALQNYYGKTYTCIREPTVAVTADSYSDLIDVSDYKGQLAVILNACAGTGTAAPTLDVAVYTSADSGTAGSGTGYDAISGAEFTQVTTTKSHQVIALDQRACSQFVKLYFNINTNAQFKVAATLVGDDAGH